MTDQPGEFQSWIGHESIRGDRPRRLHVVRAQAAAAGRRLTGPARMLPGLAAAGCAFAGTLILWGIGWALLVAAVLLLAVDARTDRS
jgi:hypothetical protein